MSNINKTIIQPIFDRVYIHLLTQNKKAMRGSDCVFRTCAGEECAIGCLIPESIHEKNPTGGVPSLFGHHPEMEQILGIKIGSAEYGFLTHLQNIHDDYNVSEWQEHLDRLAARHDLTTPVV